MALRVEVAARTDVGQRRSNNEDSFFVDEAAGLLVVADGLGGHASGEVASRIAVETIRDQIRGWAAGGAPPPAMGAAPEGLSEAAAHLANSIRFANQVIHGTASRRPDYQGMATTVVAALLRGNRLVLAHVGDSRIYRVRDRKLEQVSRDHSLVREQVALGLITEAEAEISPQRNVVTRALGMEPAVRVDVQEQDVQEGDIYLLCSDGLTDMVDEPAILEAVLQAGDRLDAACGTLIDLANAQGGRDNITAVLARFTGGDVSARESRPGFWHRILGGGA
jgi:protein phosphatase